MRQLKLNAARENSELLECQCCFDDECLFEDMAPCPEGHLYCKECIRRSIEAAVSEGRAKFPCITGIYFSVFGFCDRTLFQFDYGHFSKDYIDNLLND